MKTTLYLCAIGALACASIVVACGDDEPATTTTTTTTTTGGNGGTGGDTGGGGGTGGTVTPNVPNLGAQQDRMGRPAINTALNNTFLYTLGGGTPVTDMERHDAEGDYNGDDDAAGWAATWGNDFAVSLALVDSLDANCQNGLASGGDETDPMNYATPSAVLANDWLLVKGDASEACGMAIGYLAVEANFLGIANDECGGRKPSYDVIDASYGGLAAGDLAAVPDGVAAGIGAMSEDAFPYLADSTAND
jgi:hypothetical protein